MSIPEKQLKVLGRSWGKNGDLHMPLASSYNWRVSSPALLTLWKCHSGRHGDFSITLQELERGEKGSP